MIIKQLPAELSLAIKGFDTIEIYLVILVVKPSSYYFVIYFWTHFKKTGNVFYISVEQGKKFIVRTDYTI